MSQSPNPSDPREVKPNQRPAPTTRSRLQSLLQMLKQLGGIVLAFVPVVLDLLKQLWQITLQLLRWLSQWWTATLPKLRRILPASLRNLPDMVLTAAAVTLLALLIWLPLTLTHRAPATTISTRPVPSEQIDSPTPTRPSRPSQDAERIAAIQEQLAAVTAEYDAELIEAVQVSFVRNRLTINVSNGWSALDSAQHNRLANDLFKRAKKLNFDQLEIADLEGTLLARSPVVGAEMVILRGE